MEYSIKQLASLADVSVRTLHYYDEVGILKPAYIKQNGYRVYGEKELLVLQQILFYRELEFSIEEIKNILLHKDFSIEHALTDHRAILTLKKNRLEQLIQTIDKTINKIKKEADMNNDELYDGFSKEQEESYAKEAKERWGHTEAYKQSQERYGKMSKEDIQNIQEEGDKLLKEIVANMDKGPTSIEVQKLIAKHYDGLRVFYEPNMEMYRGLGSMYVDDKRFTAFFDKYDPRLAVFMRDAMHAYCDANE